MKNFDVIVIGGGPAGYVAAIRCAQLGMKTACVEKWRNDDKPVLGGTCLNVGCIPSKALLDSAYAYKTTNTGVGIHGISVEDVKMDISIMMERKQDIVQQLTGGISGLFRANTVDSFYGIASITNDKSVSVQAQDNTVEQLSATNIIIATGSIPTQIPCATVDQKNIVDSAGALSFDSVPQKICVIGAGVIGLELGSVWNWLGSEVVILEATDSFLSSMDKEISKAAFNILTKQKLDIRLSTAVSQVMPTDSGATVTYKTHDGEKEEQFNKVVVCVGRKPYTQDLSANQDLFEIDEKGFIKVDDHCATLTEGIWAIGDVVRGPMLAHKASEEGIMVAERIAGQHTQVNYDLVPSVIYTHPEIASVGQTEEQLKSQGIEYSVGKFPFAANSRALAAASAEGFVKILAEKSTDTIKGVHCIGPNATEIVQQAVIAMEFSASAEDLGLTMFAHPSVSEGLHEAALSVHNHAIHIINK